MQIVHRGRPVAGMILTRQNPGAESPAARSFEPARRYRNATNLTQRNMSGDSWGIREEGRRRNCQSPPCRPCGEISRITAASPAAHASSNTTSPEHAGENCVSSRSWHHTPSNTRRCPVTSLGARSVLTVESVPWRCSSSARNAASRACTSLSCTVGAGGSGFSSGGFG